MHINQINAWADFWRNQIGVNVVPANTVKKTTWISWSKDPRGNWQEIPIPKGIHDEWKRNGDFKNGMAVICGKIFRGNNIGKYLCAIDCDNKLAIEEMTKDLQRLSQHTIVEQHPDNPDKAHIYFLTTKPMKKKSSDSTNAELSKKMKANEVPALEVKGEGQHGVMYCTPSPHAGGSNYEIIGTKEPAIMDNVDTVIKTICDKYNLGIGDDGKIPMKILYDPETKIYAGHNRHEAVMRYCESILRRFPKMKTDEFNDMAMLWNNRHCEPPLSDSEMEKQKKDAIRFIADQITQEEIVKKTEAQKFGTMPFWSKVDDYTKIMNPEGKFIKCLDCNGTLINADPMEQKHYGHRVILV